MPQDSPLFWYNLRTQYENLGDLVINRECIHFLREHGDVVVNTAGVPAAFVQGLCLDDTEICNDNSAFQKGLLKAGQGSFLVLVPGAVPSSLKLKDLPRQLLLVLHFKLLALRGVKIVRAGISIDESTRLRQFIEKMKSESMSFFGPRDSASLARARKFGIKNAKPFQDFAFLLPIHKRIPHPDDAIVISFRAHDDQEAEELLNALDSAVEQIDPNRRRRIVLVNQVDHDRNFSVFLGDHFATHRAVSFVDHADGTDKVFTAYDRAVCVLSNRLHVLLFALSRSASIWALVHPRRNAKIIGLFNDVGLSDRIIDLSRGRESIEKINLYDDVDMNAFTKAAAQLREQFNQALARK